MTTPPRKIENDPAMMALCLPMMDGDVSLPAAASCLLVNPVPVTPWAFPPDAALWQWWHGPAHALLAQGRGTLHSESLPADTTYDAVFIRLPRQRAEALYAMQQGFARLKAGGVFVVAAANDAGGARLEKDLRPFLPRLCSASKHKCRVIHAVKAADDALPPSWGADGRARLHPGMQLMTQPGLFSWDRPDPASLLLLRYLPPGLSGAVADFGCGIGVLSAAILEQSPDVKRLLCMDADARAVAACHENLVAHGMGRDIECVWGDLSIPRTWPAAQQVNTVVMNPPFHAEKAQAIGLGQSFITNAASILKRNGTVFMVANAHLPYEATLAASFSTVEKLHEGQGFKIFRARK